MTTAEVGAHIARSLAVKAIETAAPHWAANPGEHVRLTTVLQRNDDADFANNLGALYQGKVTPEDSTHLRGTIGSELIKAKLNAEVKGQQVLLLQIAGITELNGLQDALANRYGSQDADHKAAHNQYFKEAVTETNKNSFRQIAASKAFAYKIAEMNDPAALDAMARVKTPQDLTQLLAASNAFGLDNPAGKPAREAITDLNEIRKLSALAHIRSNLLPRSPQSEPEWQQATAHADKLATLLDPAFTAANYASQFLAANPKPEELQPFKDYFRDEARRDEARKMALASLLPIVLKNASPEQLTAITTANDEGGLKQAVAAVLGNQHANDLIDADLGSDYNLKIRASAQLNLMPQLLAGKDYAQLSGIVQAAGWAGFEDGVRTLLNGLNQNDSQNLEAGLIQALVKQYPADQDLTLLVNLSKPGISEAEFKVALTGLGIQRQDWVNPARMQMVQKAASERAMQIQTEKTIGVPLDARPELKKVMQSLSAAKQASLAAKPELIALLASRTKPEQIKELLQERHLDVEALSKENTNQRLLNKIHNPALADVLRNLNVKVDADQVRRINDYLASKDTSNQLYGLLGLKESVNRLWGLLGSSNTHINEAALNRAFGFNDDRTNLVNNAIEIDAVTQHTHNEPLIAYRKAVSPANPDGKRRVAAFLMGLRKTQEFPVARLDSLCAHIDAAKDRNELLNLIQGDPALDAVMPADFKRQLTEGTYNSLKQNLKSDQLKGMSLENLTAALGTRHAEIQANLDKLHNLQKAQQRSTRSALKAFSEVEEALWLDPVNEGLSKTNAKRIEEDLKNTEKLCNIVIPSLKAHLALIEEQYKSLPQNEPNRKKADLITKERQFLKKRMMKSVPN